MSFTIGAANSIHTIFECPHCRETIDSSAQTCRFCGAAVDHEAAQKAAEILTKVNQACSDATYMRSCALALPVFFVFRFVPFFNMLGGLGLTALSFVIPVWALIWWKRYGSIKTDDGDYGRSRTTVKVAGIVVGLVLVFLVIIPFLSTVLFAVASRAHPATQ